MPVKYSSHFENSVFTVCGRFLGRLQVPCEHRAFTCYAPKSFRD